MRNRHRAGQQGPVKGQEHPGRGWEMNTAECLRAQCKVSGPKCGVGSDEGTYRTYGRGRQVMRVTWHPDLSLLMREKGHEEGWAYS